MRKRQKRTTKVTERNFFLIDSSQSAPYIFARLGIQLVWENSRHSSIAIQIGTFVEQKTRFK
jgi:hypothetical protein